MVVENFTVGDSCGQNCIDDTVIGGGFGVTLEVSVAWAVGERAK